MRERLAVIFVCAAVLTGCGPNPPHQKIGIEYQALKDLCMPGIAGKYDKATAHRDTRSWRCKTPLALPAWKESFAQAASKRGWVPVTTAQPWLAMCHPAINGVVLRYSEDDSPDWNVGFRLSFPSEECPYIEPPEAKSLKK